MCGRSTTRPPSRNSTQSQGSCSAPHQKPAERAKRQYFLFRCAHARCRPRGPTRLKLLQAQQRDNVTTKSQKRTRRPHGCPTAAWNDPRPIHDLGPLLTADLPRVNARQSGTDLRQIDASLCRTLPHQLGNLRSGPSGREHWNCLRPDDRSYRGSTVPGTTSGKFQYDSGSVEAAIRAQGLSRTHRDRTAPTKTHEPTSRSASRWSSPDPVRLQRSDLGRLRRATPGWAFNAPSGRRCPRRPCPQTVHPQRFEQHAGPTRQIPTVVALLQSDPRPSRKHGSQPRSPVGERARNGEFLPTKHALTEIK